MDKIKQEIIIDKEPNTFNYNILAKWYDKIYQNKDYESKRYETYLSSNIKTLFLF